MSDRLGGTLARRPLHFFFILDVSGSMAADGKIQALNYAVREAVPALEDTSRSNPGVQLLVRALTFATSLRWVVPEPTAVEHLRWVDVDSEPRGVTELGLALREVAAQMQVLAASNRGFRPAIVLVSDGQPTDTAEPSFRAGLEELMATSWGSKAVRIGVGIGRDADLSVLQRFIGHDEIRPVRAEDPEQLAAAVRWASTLATGLASRPTGDGVPAVPPTLPPVSSPVW